jgi:hypothetical protein
MVDEKQVHDRVSFDINPTSRQVLENLANLGLLEKLIRSGARIHQTGCGGCIGMGQAPATGKISLRTVPRNFPERSGTKEDQVYLCSPETAAASALSGVITDQRTSNTEYPRFVEPDLIRINIQMLIAPPESGDGIELEKGPNIKPLPPFDPLPESILGPVLLKAGDDIPTDEIMPAGTQCLDKDYTYTSNWPFDPLVGNRPMPDTLIWSIVSVILLILFVALMTFIYLRYVHESDYSACEILPFSEPEPTPSQAATLPFFLVAAALLCVQILMGAITGHFKIEGTSFFGLLLGEILPYAITRTWHLQLAIFFIAASFLGADLFMGPFVGKEP